MTRQREWQLRQIKNGNCCRCGKPSESRTCFVCAEKYAWARGRRPGKSKRPGGVETYAQFLTEFGLPESTDWTRQFEKFQTT